MEDPYLAPYYSSEMQIDGRLDEEAWQHAVTIDIAYETYPAENITAPVKTDVLLFYNDTHLFVGFRAYDPDPPSIRARYNDRDQIFNDDYVLIFMDTFNDERRAFAIRSNPLGVQADDIRLPNSNSISWDAIYESEGQITDWGYIVEMAIPFNQLRFQRTNGDQVWGINLMRSYPRNVLHRLDAIPLDRNNDSVIAQFIKIKGFQGARPGRNLEIVPSLIGAHTDHRPDFPSGGLERLSRDVQAGVSARWGFTPNLTLNGSVNPDFSQVEADAYQLDINQPFALFYPERRPFFQESADYFRTLKSAVYTRVMRDPLWGLKTTGKEGSNTIGAYFVQDEMTNLIFPGTQGSASTSLDMKNTSTILRYKRDLGGRYTLGLMATDREGKDYANRLFSVDGDIRVTNSDRIQLQIMGSRTLYPDQVAHEHGQDRGEINDHFIAFEWDHNARNWGWWIDYDDVGPGFRADLGFIPMVGFRNVEGGVNYTWYGKPGSWWTMFHMNSELNYYEDYDKKPIRKNASLFLSYSGTMQSRFFFRGNVTQELYNQRTFDLIHFDSFMGLWATRDIWLNISSSFGDRIDYTHTRPGYRLRISPQISLNIGRHLQLSLNHNYENMTVDAGRLYSANISQMTTVYHFNGRMFFRAILQYVHYDYKVQNYAIEIDPEYKQLFSQLLFSYKINPFTVFFLGYSDNHQAGYDYGLRQTDRTFFTKLSYAWVL